MSGVFVGVDSSTQACKVLVVDAETGAEIAFGNAPHPEGTAVDPRKWVTALRSAWQAAGIPSRGDVLGVGVCAQQHGLVAVDRAGVPVHAALLWNDVRSHPQSERMIADLGVSRWIDAINVLPLPAITLTKLAWLRDNEPEAAAQTHRVMLPHDWLVLHLCGAFATDRSDASGTGYFSAIRNEYRPDLVERYFGTVPDLPQVLDPGESAGILLPEWGGGRNIPVSAGAGDNAAAAFGLQLEPGDLVASAGTSGTLFSTSSEAIVDQSGLTAGFADATGGHLPLLCTLNAARVLRSTAALLSVDLARFDELALAGMADTGGMTMLPYFDGERTPNLPDATGELRGLTRASFTPENLARAAVLAVANSFADCLDILRGVGLPASRVLLIGGGARSTALRALLADTLEMPVAVPTVREYSALGAARQAAWAATGVAPQWKQSVEAILQPGSDEGIREYRARYMKLRGNLTEP